MFNLGILILVTIAFLLFGYSITHTKGLSEGNYCYTRDCVLGLFTILLKGENGEAYNVSNALRLGIIGKNFQKLHRNF